MTKYHEQNVHSQRRHDNRFAAGKQYEFGKFIDKKYGPGTADKLVVLSRTTVKKLGKFEIDALTKYFRSEAERLKKEKGL